MPSKENLVRDLTSAAENHMRYERKRRIVEIWTPVAKNVELLRRLPVTFSNKDSQGLDWRNTDSSGLSIPLKGIGLLNFGQVLNVTRTDTLRYLSVQLYSTNSRGERKITPVVIFSPYTDRFDVLRLRNGTQWYERTIPSVDVLQMLASFNPNADIDWNMLKQWNMQTAAKFGSVWQVSI